MHFTPVVSHGRFHTQIVLARDWVGLGHTHTRWGGRSIRHSLGRWELCCCFLFLSADVWTIIFYFCYLLVLSVTIKYPHSLSSLARIPNHWPGVPVATIERVLLHRTKINTIPLTREELFQYRLLSLDVQYSKLCAI